MCSISVLHGVYVINYSKESEREKMEKVYSKRMDKLREELSKQNEEERVLLQKQLDVLKKKLQVSPSVRASNMSLTDSDECNVMQSVAMDISNRVVVGQEEKQAIGYQQDDDVFINCRSPPVHIQCENELDGVQLGASYTDTFINIHSGDELAKGFPQQSLYRYVLLRTSHL